MAQDKSDEAFLRKIVKPNHAATPPSRGKKRPREGPETPALIQWNNDRIPTNRTRPILPAIDATRNPYLSSAPFIHSSHVPEKMGMIAGSAEEPRCYEPLEFLGDAHLELMATEVLFYRYPHLRVGRRSTMREQMVRNDTLYRFSTWYGWSDSGGIRIDLNTKHQSKAEVWMKIMADVFEAYVAAVVLSDKVNGYATAKKWVTELWEAFGLIHSEGVAEAMVARELNATKALRLSNEAKKDKPFADGPRQAPSRAMLEESENLNYKDMLASLIEDKDNRLHYNVIRHNPDTIKSKPPDEVRLNFTGFGRWDGVQLGHARNDGNQPKKRLEQSAAKDALMGNAELVNDMAVERWRAGVKRRAEMANASGGAGAGREQGGS